MSETKLDTLRRLNSDKAERLDACRKEGLRLLARANGLEAALRDALEAMRLWGNEEDGIPHDKALDAYGAYLRGKVLLGHALIDGQPAALLESHRWRTSPERH